MQLPKPQKVYYQLKEVAEKWGLTASDIIDYAEQGKITLCLNLRDSVEATPALEAIPSEDILDPFQLLHTVPSKNIDGIFPIKANSFRAFMAPCNDGEWISLGPQAVKTRDRSPDLREFGEWDVLQQPEQNGKNRFTTDMLVIAHNEMLRFEREYALRDEGDHGIQVGDKKRKTLRGYQEMADAIGRSVASIKNWRNKQQYKKSLDMMFHEEKGRWEVDKQEFLTWARKNNKISKKKLPFLV